MDDAPNTGCPPSATDGCSGVVTYAWQGEEMIGTVVVSDVTRRGLDASLGCLVRRIGYGPLHQRTTRTTPRNRT